VHTGAFETRANGNLASSLDHAGGSTEALGVELRIAHTLSVGLKIMETATRLIGARDLAADGLEQSRESSGVEFLLPAFRPRRSSRRSGTVQSFPDITQVLFGMIAVHNLGGLWKLIVGNVPNPQGPIAEHDRTRRLAEAAARSFSPDALGKGRTCRRGIHRTGTLQGCGIGDRSCIADGSAFFIQRFRAPNGTEFYLPGLGRSVGSGSV
jgi:hypothetical protein